MMITKNGKFATIDRARFAQLRATGHFKGWTELKTESDVMFNRPAPPTKLTLKDIKALLDEKGVIYDKKCHNYQKLYSILKFYL
jgi:hypothetical protein